MLVSTQRQVASGYEHRSSLSRVLMHLDFVAARMASILAASWKWASGPRHLRALGSAEPLLHPAKATLRSEFGSGVTSRFGSVARPTRDVSCVAPQAPSSRRASAERDPGSAA
jgi:hypothetical protein